MTQAMQRKKTARVGSFLWGILGIWMVGVAAAFWIVLATRGAQLLNMPRYVWGCAPMLMFGALAFSYLSLGGEARRETTAILKLCGFFLLGGTAVCFMTGFFEGTSSLGSDPFDEIRYSLGYVIAWSALVGAPAIAFVSCGALAWSSRRRN